MSQYHTINKDKQNHLYASLDLRLEYFSKLFKFILSIVNMIAPW